ncbi:MULTISPECIES: LysR family transcriptional regulator [Cycloclasticus]|jgi:DNA-binding transcriptional LysR family regulator|uniref:Transcriptional regulator n=1 Tax=Cycloclasticus pugetii TaxID=34068 RepID=A0AB33YZA1_9GAMM|nr:MULTISPECIES: LysR family transcriptional regulator [Cycloclasticus]ATI04062.1 LysR family transcriptional regulator [Cycloclasticus sp. PY97N]EPD12283.1 transcriptional regulator [Cycloclasticus pugetii]
MENLNRMMIFYHVVDLGSFTEAAKVLKMAKSAVSRHVTLLEKQVGARLLNRTTRQLNLTEVGRIYFQSCKKIVEETQYMQNEISVLQNQPVGSLKIATTNSLGIQYITPLIVEFMRLYPKLNIELMLQDQVIDMVEENIDVCVRVGWLQNSDLVATKVADSRLVLAASPSYLKQYGPIVTPKDLEKHACVIFSLLPNPTKWTFTQKKQQETVSVSAIIKTNNAGAVKALLLQGAGASVLSHFIVAEDLREGRLVELLPNYDLGSAGVYLVYQEKQYKQLKIQLFNDFIKKNLKLD